MSDDKYDAKDLILKAEKIKEELSRQGKQILALKEMSYDLDGDVGNLIVNINRALDESAECYVPLDEVTDQLKRIEANGGTGD